MNYPQYQVPVMQNRLNQMEQQYPQFQQGFYNPIYQSPFTQQNQQNASNQYLKGRPVTSIDEAKASMIDLDGSVFIFPDYGNGKIYTKQINLDGTATLKSYVQENFNPAPKEQEPKPKESTDLEKTVNSMQNEILFLKSQIKQLQDGKGGVLNDEFNAKHDVKPTEI